MLLDMSDILIVTPVGASFKKKYLFAAIFSVLGNIRNAEWWLLLDGVRYLGEDDEKLLSETAKVNNNKLMGRYYGDSPSLATMKTQFLLKHGKSSGRKWVLYIDADMIVSYQALKGLTEGIALGCVEDVKLFLMTQYDVVNGRNFPDWCGEIKDLGTMKSVDEQFHAHHLWSWEKPDNMVSDFNYVMVGKTMSSLYCMDIAWFLKQDKLIAEYQNWKKGVRGYATKIALALKPNEKLFIVPSFAYHLGCLGNSFNSDWDNYYEGYEQEWLNIPKGKKE